MAMDFTVIQGVRQRFGDGSFGAEPQLAELQAPFVGLSKDFPFSCPNVDRAQRAVLQFESLGVTAPRADQPTRPRNIIQINGVDIPGGITAGEGEFWKTHSLIVPPNVLRDDGNVLHIECVILFQAHSIHRDDFIIDNVVLLYKTEGAGGPGGVVPQPTMVVAE